MEPERPIEKLLHETAQKRRSELGTPGELHPATRRLLQSEVARQYPGKKLSQPASAGLFSGWWTKLALASCLCCSLVMALWLFNPAPKPATQHALSTMAKAGSVPPDASFARRYALETSAAPAVTLLAAKDKSALAAVVAGESSVQEKKPTAPAATARPARALEPESVLRAPQIVNGPVDSLSMAAAAPPNRRARGLEGNVGAGNRDAFGMTPTMPLGGAAQAENVSVQRYSQLGNSSNAVLQKKVQNPVLESFKVEQSGEKLRIIDQDGSVYSGAFEIAGRPLQQAIATRTDADIAMTGQAALAGRKEAAAQSVVAAPAVAFATTAASATAANLKQPQALPAKAEQQADRPKVAYNLLGRPYSFHVMGTNNSLKKRVFFSGNLFELNDVAQTSSNTQGLAAAPTTNNLKADAESISNLQLLNSHISGTAVLDGKEQIPVEAVPSNR